jgi:diaminopimelate decarboxylase
MNTIEKDIEEILHEQIVNNDPDFFAETVKTLNKEILLDSAQTFGTPQYLLDRDLLKERALFFSQTMRKYLPQSEFFYAFKCNDLPVIVKSLKEVGFYADVAGIFELQLALKLGFDCIVFSSPGKSVDELKLAVKERKRVAINIDNFDELLRLKSVVGDKKFKIKVNVGFRLNSDSFSYGEWSKFGFELDELKDAVRMVEETPNLEWAGIHFHCSWNKTPKKYLDNIKYIGDFLSKNFSTAQLNRLRFFDIGGGFYPKLQGIINKIQDKGMILDIIGARRGNKNDAFREMNFDPYAFSIAPVEPLENFAIHISDSIKKLILPLNPGIAIYFEPGRFIATFATTILLGVMAIKKNCVIVDGGINMLGDYKFSEYSFAPIVTLSRPSIEMRRTIIYGPLCDPNDLWGYSYYGDEIRKGDVLAVLYQGAYTFSTAWRFIKPIPPYIAASGNILSVAKEAEKFQNRYANCQPF